MQRRMFWCQPCDWVCKARQSATCVFCGEPMQDQGTKWRTGKRGHREDFRPGPDRLYPYVWLNPGDGRDLLRRLTGEVIYDKHTGLYRVSRWMA
jgi:hypothetical protein